MASWPVVAITCGQPHPTSHPQEQLIFLLSGCRQSDLQRGKGVASRGETVVRTARHFPDHSKKEILFWKSLKTSRNISKPLTRFSAHCAVAPLFLTPPPLYDRHSQDTLRSRDHSLRLCPIMTRSTWGNGRHSREWRVDGGRLSRGIPQQKSDSPPTDYGQDQWPSNMWASSPTSSHHQGQNENKQRKRTECWHVTSTILVEAVGTDNTTKSPPQPHREHSLAQQKLWPEGEGTIPSIRYFI